VLITSWKEKENYILILKPSHFNAVFTKKNVNECSWSIC